MRPPAKKHACMEGQKSDEEKRVKSHFPNMLRIAITLFETKLLPSSYKLTSSSPIINN
nr:hypothetical protein Itr_chr01CG16420 [Ipomoea trifida]